MAAGLVVSACGGTTLGPLRAAPGGSAPPATTTTAPHVDPICQVAPTNQCRLESTAIAVWNKVQDAQAQATLLQVSEQQYAACIIYARLDQSLTTLPASTPVRATCSAAGLTTAEVQQIQALIMGA